MNAIEVKAEVASYLRFVRQYQLVCVEQMEQDVIAVDGNRRMIWVEVKVSIADLVRDRGKTFHQRMCQERERPLFRSERLGEAPSWLNQVRPTRFHFAMPAELIEKALPKIEDFFPWAGLLSVRPTRGRFFGHGVGSVRQAETVHDEQLEVKRVESLVKCQSASLANIYAKYARLQKRVTDGC